MTTEYAIGIDLGTTHCAMATVSLEKQDGRPRVFQVPQLVARGNLESRALLPSFLYFAHQSEGPLALPWDSGRSYSVGELARLRGAETPARVISSAKSWLSHTGIDRRSPVLPAAGAEDIEKISPVEASFRYLDHLVESWHHAERASGLSFAEQEVVLTVPASFDAAARDLTAEAAYAAGIENLTLLEEPQAALYAWIEAHSETWRHELAPGDIVLVIDIGGGTTDFSAIAVLERNDNLELYRIAVGDHILLGGDNMDLALAHLVGKKLADAGKKLDRWQMNALTHACRSAKEQLLANPDASSMPIVLPSRGSQLLGGSLRTELNRDELERTLVDGFFPRVSASEHPASRARVGLTQIGLPYAADPAVTKHLAQFLTRQADASAELEGFAKSATAARLLHPTCVLFNGGVVKSAILRQRLIETLGHWLREDGAPPPRILPGEDPDLAVARGAAYYALVRRGRGLRIRGGTAQAYYVGIESPMPAVPGVQPPITALCVAPFGMEEGSHAALPPHELGVVVGEPVRFRFFSSSVRRHDEAGTELEQWVETELSEIAPIEITFPAEGRRPGDIVPVRLTASITSVGTLLLEAVPLQPSAKDERWKVELSVRG